MPKHARNYGTLALGSGAISSSDFQVIVFIEVFVLAALGTALDL
jgi:hypothetical protein